MTERKSGYLKRVRWAILLPIVFVVVSTYLMVLSNKQFPMLRGRGTGWEVPARVINSLINGPGFFFGGLFNLFKLPMPYGLNKALAYDGTRLIGITAFWFLIGRAIDQRRAHQSLDQHHPIFAGVLFTFGALLCAVFAWGLFQDPNVNDLHMTWELMREYPLQTWTSMSVGMIVWLVAFSVYFGVKAFVAARRSLLPVQVVSDK